MKVKTNMVLLLTDAMSIQYNPGTHLEVYKRFVLHYVGLRLCDDDSKVITIDVCKVTDTKRQVLCYSYTSYLSIQKTIVPSIQWLSR